MNNELEREEEGTVAIAYLKTTEDRIVNALKQEANYSMIEITEEMIAKLIEKEKISIIEQNTPKEIAKSLMDLLNIIEQRLLHNMEKLSSR